MTSKKKVHIRISKVIILVLATLFFCFSGETFAAKIKKNNISKKKQKIEKSITSSKKATLMAPLYFYFPMYEQWEKSEIYPYNDLVFLNNYDKNSVFEDYFLRKKLIERINDWLGVRYRCPGRSRKGVDCSNFVSILLEETLGINIPAGSGTQANLFPKIEKIEELQFGDLVFFSGRNKRSKRIGHVGIYIANGLFAHSSTGKGVIYTHITDGYYLERYRHGGRIIKGDKLAYALTNPTKYNFIN